MTYVLAEQRDRDVVAAFAVYREYLEANKSRFPVSAFALASSEWYFDFADRLCPHDSWLEAVRGFVERYLRKIGRPAAITLSASNAVPSSLVLPPG